MKRDRAITPERVDAHVGAGFAEQVPNFQQRVVRILTVSVEAIEREPRGRRYHVYLQRGPLTLRDEVSYPREEAEILTKVLQRGVAEEEVRIRGYLRAESFGAGLDEVDTRPTQRGP